MKFSKYISGRNVDIYFYDCPLTQIKKGRELPKPYFVTTFFLHKTEWNRKELEFAIEHLIKLGCVYFFFHGNKDREAHWIADSCAIFDKKVAKEAKDNLIMTASSPLKEPIEDTLFDTFFLPFPREEDVAKGEYTSYVMFSIGSKEENENIKRLLMELEKTLEIAVNKK